MADRNKANASGVSPIKRDYSSYTPEQFITELEASLAENEALKLAKADLENQVAELQEELLEEQASNPEHKETFTYKGKKYEVLVKNARIPDVGDSPLSAVEICESAEAKELLVKRNSSLIREIK